MTVYVWNAGTSGDWSTATDWTPNTGPGSLDTASFTGAGTYTVTVNSSETIAAVTLNSAGATLQINSALTDNGILDVKTGTLDISSYDTVANATIEAAAAGVIELQSQATLNNVTFYGTLTAAPGYYQYLDIAGNLTMAGANGTGNGTILLNGPDDYLYFTGGSQTLNDATVDIGSAAGSTILMEYYYGVPQQLTFGPKVLIDDTGSQAFISTYESYNAIINEGTIEAETAGGTLDIGGGGTFTNTGTIIVANEGTLLSQLSNFNNSGKITVTGAVLNIGGSFSNTGTIIDTNSVLTLSGYVTTAGLGTIKRSGGTLVLAGTLDNTGGTLSLVAGSAIGTTELSGTLTNGIVHDAGGGLVLLSGAVLSDVTYEGSAVIADYVSLTFENGVVLTGLSGTGNGALNLTGVDDSLSLSGSTAQTIDNATIDIGNAIGGDAIYVNDTATLGAHLLLAQTSTYATISVQSGLLTNDGTISAGVAGGLFTVQNGTFDNAGLIAVSNGDTVNLDSPTVINTGTITVATGGVLTLGEPTGSLTNTGKVSMSGGQINLGGTALTVAQITAIARTGGLLNIAGTLGLAAGTLTVGPATALGTLEVTGSVQNGTISDAGSGLVFNATSYAPVVLTNIVYKGSLDLSPNSSVVEVEGSFSLTGLTGGTAFIKLTGAGSELLVMGSRTLDNTTIDIGGSPQPGLGTGYNASLSSVPINGSTPVTLTFGPALDIVQTGLSASVNASAYTGGSIVNEGTITAGVSGGSFSLNSGTFANTGVIDVLNGDTFYEANSSFTNSGKVVVTTGGDLVLEGAWTNTGTISENAGTVVLDGQLNLAEVTEITRTGGLIVIGGDIALAGATMSVGTGSKLGDFGVSGSISGGIIHDAGGGLVFGSNGASASVGNLTYEGTLDVGPSQPSSSTSLAGTLLETGGLILTNTAGHGAGALVLNGGSLSTDLQFENSQTIDNATITMGGSGDSTLGIQEVYGGSTITFGAHLTVVQTCSYAVIDGYGYSGYYDYADDQFVNDGTIDAGVRHGDMDIYGPTFTNNGVINVSNGDFLYLEPGNLTNTGTIAATAGGIIEYGFDTYSDTGVISETNATLLIYGSLNLTQLGGITRSGGVVEIAGSLELAGAALDVGTGSAIGSLTLTGVIADGTIQDAGGGIQFYGQYIGTTGTLDNITYQGVLNLQNSFSSVTVNNGLALTGAGGTGTGTVLLTGAGSTMTFDNSQTFNNATITIGNSALQSLLSFDDTSYDGETLTLGPHLLLQTKTGLSAIESTRGLGDTILNEGTLQDIVGGATLSVFGGTFENAYAVSVGNSAVLFLEPDQLINNNGAAIKVSGGGLVVVGAATGAGLFDILTGGTMDFSDTVASTVTATFGGTKGVLELENPTDFAGKIAGFAAGQTIDLVGVSATAATISGTTLTVTSGTTTIAQLALTAALTGTATAATDGRGGTDITFTAAPAKMTFIAGTDDKGTFSGTTSALAGQTLSDFVSGDSIDLTDLSFASAVLKVATSAKDAVLSVSGGGHVAAITLAGSFAAGDFHKVADGHGGTLISYLVPG